MFLSGTGTGVLFPVMLGMHMRKPVIAIALAATLLTAGCGEYGHDAAKGDRDTGPADVINFPQGFRNVAHKCDGPNMVYVTSRGTDVRLTSTVAIVPNDPRCTGGR